MSSASKFLFALLVILGAVVILSRCSSAQEIVITFGGDTNAAALREILAPYVDAARRVSGGRGTSSSAPRRRKAGQDYGAVRAWAKENGYQVSDRGRVPATVLEAYEAAR